jgi:hypothetical protein
VAAQQPAAGNDSNSTATAIKTESSNSVKIDSEIREKVKQEQHEDLDKEITDIKLRASSGSKNRFSTSFFMMYFGPAVNNLNDSVRPTLGAQRVQDNVNITGNVGVRYRIDKNKSIFVSGGFRRADPLHASESSQPTTLSSPGINFNNTKAYGLYQVSNEVGMTVQTAPERRAINELGSATYSLAAVHPIGLSRFDVGTTARAGYTSFETMNVKNKVLSQQKRMNLELLPSLQYRATDKLVAFTSVSVLNLAQYRTADGFNGFSQQTSTETIGLGYAATRDLYLSPFVSLEPTQVALSKISFNILTRMNF